MDVKMKEHPYRTMIDYLLARHETPQEITNMLTDLGNIDYLDWEGLIEEYQAEKRLRYVYLPCSRCRIVSNREAWKPIKEKLIGGSMICRDCAVELSGECTYICAWCQKPYLSLRSQEQDMDVCGTCDHHYKFVGGQLSRARVLNLPATLTVRQWHITLDHFNHSCAYCSNTSYDCMEHYLPLSLGGGTTWDNCVPACSKCNLRKKGKHPDEFTRLFPAENIACIRGYLEHASSLALDV